MKPIDSFNGSGEFELVSQRTQVMRTVLKSEGVSKTLMHLLTGQVSVRSFAHGVEAGDLW